MTTTKNGKKPKKTKLTIMQMQEEILAEGYQFTENVFNNGDAENCMVTLTKNTDPCALDAGIDALRDAYGGWGRFTRQRAWEMAYKELVKKRK